ncbi:hypothetical protein N7535_006857 [Penicillium sp. DV-2018c]|nr:hypothetical protein N7461_007061 [Penicillium sp. DV-2018c]KAJ5567551.1 hypothetical protein N7535_006857 [Penicillium sp. DV-2018c]
MATLPTPSAEAPFQSCLVTLCILHIVCTIVGSRNELLHTAILSAAGVTTTIATAGAVLVSVLGAQRALQTSSLLEIYYTILAIIYLPRLRSLWLSPHVNIARNLWTANYILTVLVALLESCGGEICQLSSLKSKNSQEAELGFWGRCLFAWVLPTLRQGYSRALRADEIPSVDRPLRGHEARLRLQNAWSRCKPRYRLLKAIFLAYAWDISACIPPRLVLGGFTICQPFLIKAAIDLSRQGSSPPFDEYRKALIGAFVLVYIGMAISKAVYGRLVNRVMGMTRAGLMSVIYHRTMELNKYNLGDSQAITLMGTDAERICHSLKSFHGCWISVIEITIAAYLLAREVGLTCVVSIVVSVVCMLCIMPVSRHIVPAQKDWVVRVQRRMTTTLTMLGNMKAVKMLGLSKALYTTVSNLREEELETSEVFRKLLICTVTLWVTANLPADLAPYATFTVYAIISLARRDGSLLATRAFTSLSLISILTSRLLSFIQSLPQFAQCLGCLDRIGAYISEPCQDTVLCGQTKGTMGPCSDEEPLCEDKVPPSTELDPRNLNLTVNKGITVIVGASGSGKTTLVESILNDTTSSAVGYCAETPWLLNDTIRTNIIGVNGQYEETWYTFCTSMAALTHDLSAFPAGDLHVVGDNGVALSGGQKKRVALARAIYSRLPVLILDDIWSGLDSKNLQYLQSNLFDKDGYFRQAGISVILTSRALPPWADQVVVLQAGSVIAMGSYEEVLSHEPKIIGSHLSDNFEAMELVKEEGDETIKGMPLIAESAPNHTAPACPTDLKEDLSRRTGTWNTYRYYISRAGRWKPPCFLFCCIASAFFSNFITIWIQWWSEANGKTPNQNPGYYLGVYAALVGLTKKSLLIIGIINDTAQALHSDLLKATLNAPYSFFQKTDSGATANRFSQDMDLIDMKLPMFAIGFTGAASLCLVKAILLCVVGKYFALTMPLLLLIIWSIQRYYLRTSRQVRLLEIEAKSPLYTHFTETLAGVSTIKAYHWQSQFQQTCDEHINYSQSTYYMLLSIQQWLSLVLDLLVALIAIVIAVITTCFHHKFSPGDIGVALNLVLTFNDALAQAITSWTQVETSIGAVTRVQQFQDTTPTEHRQGATELPKSVHGWPSRGAIVFDQVTACHSLNTPAALTNINLTIKPGEKLAICGPSGSGKTSLILALLQMIDVRSGSIRIDDHDLQSLQPDDIRSRINVVPQDPFFIPGTVKYNLDVTETTSDMSMETALRKVALWEKISYGGGLSADLQSTSWSAGEKQLFALARALTKDCQIVILDEVTSSVDSATEIIMQRIIDEEFANRTVISVVHRLGNIERFDRVAVPQRGELVECDTPQVLLSRDSIFRDMYASSLGQSY